MTLSGFFASRVTGPDRSSARDQVDSELRQEVAFHFDQLVDEFAADGLPPRRGAARGAARASATSTLLEEQARDVRRVTWLHDFWQDLLFGLRMLRKNRGFTAVALGVSGAGHWRQYRGARRDERVARQEACRFRTPTGS